MNRSAKFQVSDRWIGADEKCFVIAEAGVSHFGNREKAFQLVDLAVDAGADAVKFQIYDVDEMISRESSDWKERLGPRALPLPVFFELKQYCKRKGIIFFATAHDEWGLEALIELGVDCFKIGSGELANQQFIERIASLGRPVFLSTGMYSIQDVTLVVEQFNKAGNPNLALLHCVTQYPTLPKNVNLKVIELYRAKFGGVIGYSDHTAGYHLPLIAVGLGAQVIEKHICLDFDVPNAQDWKVSCGPHNFKCFIGELREVEMALGVAEKIVSPAEALNKTWACKSIVLDVDKNIGETLHEEDIVFKRPGSGISPTKLNEVIGKKVTKSIAKDSLLKWKDLQ